MHEKINELGFAISGGLAAAIFVLIADVFIWIKFVPLYNSILIGAYGAGGLTTLGIIKAVFLSLILAFVLGFVLSWIFAWTYNKLPRFKVAE